MKRFNLEQNFDEKKDLIEELKNLINQDTSINEKYNQFKKIQNSWFKIGPVPRTKSGKIVELAVKNIIEGNKIKNKEALANPLSLNQYINIKELQY